MRPHLNPSILFAAACVHLRVLAQGLFASTRNNNDQGGDRQGNKSHSGSYPDLVRAPGLDSAVVSGGLALCGGAASLSLERYRRRR
jgi:hypothetical protein